MGKSSTSAPTPVDPTVSIAAQNTANADTARLQQTLNSVNTRGPYGTVTYDQNPDNPDRWTQTTTLSPLEQQTYDLSKQATNTALGVANDQALRVQQALGQQINMNQIPGLQSNVRASDVPLRPDQPPETFQESLGNIDFTADRNAVTDAVFQQALSRLNPQYGQMRSQRENALANQGIGINSQAYGNAQDQLGRQENDAYNQAAFTAIQRGLDAQNQGFNQRLQSGQFYNDAQSRNDQAQLANFNARLGAQNQQFNQGLAGAQLGNTARQQAINEAAYQQNLPMNQLSAILGLGQVGAPQGVQYSPVQVNGTDVLGAYGLQASQQNANYQQQLGQQNALIGGLAQLGGAAIKAGTFSDRRLKRDIHRLGTRSDGLGVYLYRYLWSPVQYVGVMAQEVLKVKPSAVVIMPNGYYGVNYGEL